MAEALSQTKAEKAGLALAVTAVKAYYGLVIAQQEYATAQQDLDQANRFVALGQSLERSGRKPHSDVVKYQLQQSAEEKSFREAILAIESARLDLGVLLFCDFDETREVVDDLRLAPPVPRFSEVLAMAPSEQNRLSLRESFIREEPAAAGYRAQLCVICNMFSRLIAPQCEAQSLANLTHTR